MVKLSCRDDNERINERRQNDVYDRIRPDRLSKRFNRYPMERNRDIFSTRPNSGHHKRSLINAVLYLVDSGCKWRSLPHDFPPWSAVHSFYRRARLSGLWETVLIAVVEKTRLRASRNELPSYGIIDSQSIKTIYASDERGIDGGKKIKGRKRHIVVDTMGNLLSVVVHAANIHDTKSGKEPAKQAYLMYPTIEIFCGDAGYRKSFEEDMLREFGFTIDISERIKPGFEILPKRWIVERTFAWMGNSRRLSKDYEILTNSAEAMVYISHLHTLLKRIG